MNVVESGLRTGKEDGSHIDGRARYDDEGCVKEENIIPKERLEGCVEEELGFLEWRSWDPLGLHRDAG